MILQSQNQLKYVYRTQTNNYSPLLEMVTWVAEYSLLVRIAIAKITSNTPTMPCVLTRTPGSENTLPTRTLGSENNFT